MPAVVRDFPDATLVIVGDGPLRGELEAMVERLNIGEHVRFVGAIPQTDLPTYYATADVFIAPSIVAEGGDTESFGLVFAEALACGCPVVASDIGGIGDIIVHDRTGITVPERDPTAIADGIRRLVNDQALRDLLRDAGIRRVRERFDQQVVADRYAEVILQMGRAAR